MVRWQQCLASAWLRQARWLWLLRPAEFAFRLVSALRRAFYRLGLLKTYSAECPVVVVGSITAGGSGKTPVVIALVQAMRERGARVGVVSRGYGALAGDFPRVVGEDSTFTECGDEPLVIYRRTGVPCVVAPARADAARMLLQNFDIDLVISDDGLQHYALGRDMEVALLDASAGLGNEFCLPAGPLREPKSRLRRVDFTLVRGRGDEATSIAYKAEALVNLQSGEELAPDCSVLGREVYAVTAIGLPDQFRRTLEDLGFRPRLVSFPDHYRYRRSDLAEFIDQPVIMTEKDTVKCASLVGPNTWFLRINAQLPDALLDAVAALANR